MSDSDAEQYVIPLRTHTSLWHVEKRLYKLYDWTLPMPVSVRQVGFFLCFSVPWWLLLSLVGLPFAAPWHVLWLAPPVLVTIISSRPVAEGKRLFELAGSQIRFLIEPKILAGFRKYAEPDTIQATTRIWAPHT